MENTTYHSLPNPCENVPSTQQVLSTCTYVIPFVKQSSEMQINQSEWMHQMMAFFPPLTISVLAFFGLEVHIYRHLHWVLFRVGE